MTAVTINNPQGIYYGVYDNAGTYTQASLINPPTHFAVLDEIPTVAGTYNATIYAQSEEVEAEYQVEIDVYFQPLIEGFFEGVLTAEGFDETLDGAVSGTCYLPEVLADRLNSEIDVFLSDTDFDTNFTTNDIQGTDKFDTLLYTLIFTDARATKYQVENAFFRRGWLGDLEQRIFRSRVWLKDMARLTDEDLAELTAYVKQALDYLTENKIVDRFEVDSIIQNNEAGSNITLYIGNDTIEKYVPIWRGTV